jgi:hypothetical protein
MIAQVSLSARERTRQTCQASAIDVGIIHSTIAPVLGATCVPSSADLA